MIRAILIGVIGLAVLGVVGLVILAQLVPRPANLGMTDGVLAPCPDTPNCVSTQTERPEQRMAPIPYTTTTDEARERLRAVVLAQPRVVILEETPTYMATVFRTPTFRFPDDVEFAFDESQQVIHFRSASRLGQGDMGVNRSRMEAITAAFQAR